MLRLRGWLPWLMVAGLLGSTSVWAQPPSDMGERFRKEMDQLRQQYRYNFMLRDNFLKIIEMEKQGKAPLTQGQAQKMLGIITPLRKKEKLKAEEAKQAIKQMNAVLTAKQLTQMSLVKLPERQMGQGQRPGGSGQGGPPANFDMNRALQGMRERFKDFNPFYVPAKPDIPPNATAQQRQRMTEAHQRRQKEFAQQMAVLEKKAGKR